MNKLKFAVIGKSNYLYWDTHVASALKGLGHEVLHFQINTRPLHVQLVRGVSKGLLGDKTGKSLTDRWHAKILSKQLEVFCPDVIFYVSAMFIPIEYYEIIESLPFKSKIVGWDGDCGAGYEQNKKYVPFLDILLEIEKVYCEQNSLGFKQMVHFPFCANPIIHKKYNESREHKLYFCGAWSPERDAVFSELTDFPLVLKGWGWENLSKRGKKFEIVKGVVDIVSQVNDYNRYSIVLNRHQSSNNHFSALNMRTFESPACGALLMNDWREHLSDCYVDGEEILVYRTTDELKILCDEYLTDCAKVKKIADQGYARTVQEHTYMHRMEYLLKII